MATFLFGYIIYDIFANQPVCSNNPWGVPSYFTSVSEYNNDTQSVNSLEWTLASPISFHAYKMLPTQS